MVLAGAEWRVFERNANMFDLRDSNLGAAELGYIHKCLYYLPYSFAFPCSFDLLSATSNRGRAEHKYLHIRHDTRMSQPT